MDAWAAVIWYTVTLAVVWAASSVARRAFPEDGPAQVAMHVLVLMWTWIVLTSFILGTFSKLNTTALGSGVLLVAAASARWGLLGDDRSSECDRRCQVERSVSDATPRQHRISIWPMVWPSVAGLGGALVIVQGLLQFPVDWDTLMYHRPLMNHWLQSGSLYAPDCWVWQVPGNNELLGLWWAAPFSGDFWVPLMNLPAVLLLALGTFELGRLLGLTPLVRHTTVLAMVASEVVFRQITDAKNDMAVAGLFVAGIAYGIRHLQGRRRDDLLLSGATLGLLAGIKYYALGYAAVGWMGLVVITWLQDGRPKALRLAATSAGLILVTGGWWYARNFVVSGTPLYPLGYAGPNTAAAEMPRSAWRSSIVGNGRIEVLPQYVESIWATAGPCQTLAILALPFTAAWLPASSLFHKKQELTARAVALRIGLAAMLLGAWLNFGLTPFTTDRDDEFQLTYPYTVARFSQAPLLLSLMALGLALSDLLRWIQRHARQSRARMLVARALLTTLAATSAVSLYVATTEALNEEALLLLLIAFDIGAGFVLIRELLTICTSARHYAQAAVVLSGCIAFVATSAWLSNWWHGSFAVHFDRWYGVQTFSMLEQWRGERPSIASTYSRHYPFFGSRRQFHAFTPRRFASQEAMLAYLNSHGMDLIALAHEKINQFTRHTEVNCWVEERPDIFHRIEVGRGFSVYRINQNRLQVELQRVTSNNTALAAER